MGVWPVLRVQTLTLADHARVTITYAALLHIWHGGWGNAR